MTHMPSEIDRRRLLALGAGAIAAPTLLSATSAAAATRGVHKSAIVINALGGLINPNTRPDGPPPRSGVANTSSRAIDQRVIDDARASGLTAVNVTLGYVAGEMEPFEHSVREIGVWNTRIEARPNDLLKILTAADILRAKGENRIGLIYGFQNGAMMGKDPFPASTSSPTSASAFSSSPIIPPTPLGDGSMAPDNRGLTPFGREVVERLNEQKMIVDLSHSGEKTCLEARAHFEAPISINHTGCRAVTDLPRNKTDAELRLVAEARRLRRHLFHALPQPLRPRPRGGCRRAYRPCGEDLRRGSCRHRHRRRS
jgi:membrane dipeptidase